MRLHCKDIGDTFLIYGRFLKIGNGKNYRIGMFLLNYAVLTKIVYKGLENIPI